MTFRALTSLSFLRTDAYKNSMAEAGAPLRPETFHYSHRRGGYNGWHYMPVDVKEFIKSKTPTMSTEEHIFLEQHGYSVGAAYRKALQSEVEVLGVPKGRWFYNKEPAFLVRSASALVSWFEPEALMLQFQIQAATAIKTRTHEGKFKFATCEEEKQILLALFDDLGVKAPEITVKSDEYYKDCFARAKAIVDLVGDPKRVFEVGYRAVSCIEQHRIALTAIRDAGIVRTSNMYLAKELGMLPVGTMGHEHIQRNGSDYEAYAAMRDRFPGFLSNLTDTYDALRSGIPSALKIIAEHPDVVAGLRFDSEDKILGQYTYAIARANELGIHPVLTLESGWNLEKTVKFEALREALNWPSEKQCYGYGGYLVQPTWDTFLRDDVSAIWKLSKTGIRPTLKFGDEVGGAKKTLPGDPVIWRAMPMNLDQTNIIGQLGEDMPVGYYDEFSEGSNFLDKPRVQGSYKVKLSPLTQAYVNQCEKQREQSILAAQEVSK